MVKRKLSSLGKERSSINFFCFVITCAVLFLTIQIAGAGDQFLKRLETASNVNAGQPDYTDTYIDGDYLSDSYYNSGGLGWLYDIVHKFNKALIKDPIPKGLITIDGNNTVTHADEETIRSKLQDSYILLSIAIAATVLVGLLLLLSGLFYCCCLCCAPSKTAEADRARNLACSITLLIICSVLLVMGSAGSLLTNVRLKCDLDNLPDNMINSISDVCTFLNITSQQIDILLKTNFRQFTDGINEILDESSTNFLVEMDQFTNTSFLDGIEAYVKRLPKFSTDFERLNDNLQYLITFVNNNINPAFQKVKDDMSDITKNCNGPLDDACKKIESKIDDVKINEDITKLPDLSKQIQELNNVIDQLKQAHIDDGKETLNKIIIDVKSAITDSKKDAQAQINDAGKKISSSVDNITEIIRNTTDQLDKYQPGHEQYEHNDTIFDKINNYNRFGGGTFRWYTALFGSVILIFITILIIVGLVFAIYGSDTPNSCCTKSCGGRYLKCAVLTIFFFSWVITFLVACYMLIGTIADQAVCEQLRDPKNSSLFEIIDSYNTSKQGFDIKISDVIVNCHQNKTIYKVFNLKQAYDIETVKTLVKEEDMAEAIKAINDITDKFNFEHIELLNSKQAATLENVINSKFATYNFKDLLKVMSANVTNVSPASLKDQLKQFADQAEKLQPGLKNKLDNLKTDFNNFCAAIDQITVKIKDTIETVTDVVADLSVNGTSLKNGMQAFVDGVKTLQDNLQKNARPMINEASKNLTTNLFHLYQNYINRLIQKTEDDVGNCAPLSNIYNATLVEACDGIVNTMNGFWFTLFCSFWIFIPTVILLIRLSSNLST